MTELEKKKLLHAVNKQQQHALYFGQYKYMRLFFWILTIL